MGALRHSGLTGIGRLCADAPVHAGLQGRPADERGEQYGGGFFHPCENMEISEELKALT